MVSCNDVLGVCRNGNTHLHTGSEDLRGPCISIIIAIIGATADRCAYLVLTRKVNAARNKARRNRDRSPRGAVIGRPIQERSRRIRNEHETTIAADCRGQRYSRRQRRSRPCQTGVIAEKYRICRVKGSRYHRQPCRVHANVPPIGTQNRGPCGSVISA